MEALNTGEDVRGSHRMRDESSEVVSSVLPSGAQRPAWEDSVWLERTVMVLPDGTVGLFQRDF